MMNQAGRFKVRIKYRMPVWLRGLLILLLLPGASAIADDASGVSEPGAEPSAALVFAFWTNATPPFAVKEGDKLVGGIIHDLGKELARRLNRPAEFRLLPTRRIERELLAGGVDLDCVSSPIWKASPDAYGWSPVLFEGADRFLIKTGAGAIDSLADLRGKRVGTYADYVYHPDISEMLKADEAHNVTVKDIEHGIRLLLADRIDTLIDFGVLLRYQIREKGLGQQLSLAGFPADEFQLMCAYSPKMKVAKAEVDRQLQAMVEDQTIKRILARYR